MVDVATLELTARTDGLLKAEQALDRVSAAAVRTDAAADRVTAGAAQMNSAMTQVNRSAAATRVGFQNLGFQVQDFAVQVGAGTSATQALAQQLPQLLSGFGLLGIALGTASAVLIPIAGYFLNSADAASTFEESLDQLTSVTDALDEAQGILMMTNAELIGQYGEMAGAVRAAAEALVALQSAEAAAALSQLIIDNSEALDLFTGQLSGLFQAGEASWEVLNRIQEQFGVTREEADALRTAFRDLRFAADFEGQQQALERIQRLMAQTGISAEQLPAPLRQALIQYNQLTIAGAELQAKTEAANATLRQMPPILQSAATAAGSAAAAVAGIGSAAEGAFGAVSSLVGKMWEMAQARIAANEALDAIAFENSPGGQALGRYGGRGTTSNRPVTLGTGEIVNTGLGAGTGSAGGGGGGAASDGFAQRLERLQEELMTEQEVVDAWYQEQQAILMDRRAVELLGEEEHKAALERLELEHQERLRNIQSEVQNTRLSDAASFFGGMANLAAAGGSKLAKAAQTFGAAEALVNSYVAFTAVLRDPAFIGRPLARIGAAASVLAQGLGAVRAIKSGGGGAVGSVGGSAVGSQPSTAEAPQNRIIRVNIEGDTMFAEALRGSIRTIADALGEERNIGGFVVA
jgi:hypothetical protein